MNVLWIEDENRNDISKSIGLDDLFIQNNINLVTPNDYSEALLKVKEANIDYDFVILDINLEKWDFNDDIIQNISKEYDLDKTDAKFKEEAGFHLFIKLILLNFEKNRIVFLTGNTNSNYKIEDKDNLLQELIILLKTKIKSETQAKILEKLSKLQDFLGDKESVKIKEIWDKDRDDENLNTDLSSYLISLGDKEDNKELNTYESFASLFKSARIPIAKSINKNDEKGFNKWFLENLTAKNQEYKYIVLRRGVIDAIRELSKILNVNNILLYKYHKDKKSNNNPEYYKKYLQKLFLFLPHKKPENLSESLFVFIKEVASELDVDIDYFKLNYKRELDKSEIKKYEFPQFQKYSISQTKKLRNWTAHNHLIKQYFNEELVGYLFLISMRALFDLDGNIVYDYEKIILSLYYNIGDIPKSTELKKEIAKSYFKIADSQLSKTKRIDFIEMLNNTTHNNKISKTNLFEIFWHGLHPARQKVKPTSNHYTAENDGFVKTFINFDDFDFKNNPIAKSIGQAIYNLSFSR